MDKTIEIVIAAMVILIVATILLFLVQDQTDGFDGFLNDQQSNAQCELWKTQYRNSDCEDTDLESKISSGQNSCGQVPTC